MIRRLVDAIFHRQPVTLPEQYFMPIAIVGVMLAMAISLAIGLHQSVWFDEAYSIILAKQSTAELLHLTAIDVHPPLYYLLLKGWAAIFGWSEVALRSFSVSAMGSAILVGALLVKKLFGVRAALITLPFIIFAPFLLRYGFEIRMYALASLIGVAATYVLISALQANDKQRQWRLYLLYALLVAIGVYTLYYMVLLWLAHLAWLVWMAKKNKQPILRTPWLVALCSSVVLFLPWLPTLVSQVGSGALAAISQPLTIDNLIGVVSFMFVYQPTWQLSALMSLVIVFVIIALIVLLQRVWKSTDEKQHSYLLLLVLYVLSPIVILMLVSLVKPMYVERYLSHVIIAGSMLVGVVVALALTQKPTKRIVAMSVGLLAAMLIGVAQLVNVGNYNFQRLQIPAVKEIASTIKDCGKDTTVFAADPYTAIELAYYLPDCEIRFYSETLELRGGYAPLSNSTLHVTNPESELANSKKLVYVYYDEQKLKMPDTLSEVSNISIGQLYAATFSAE